MIELQQPAQPLAAAQPAVRGANPVLDLREKQRVLLALVISLSVVMPDELFDRAPKRSLAEQDQLHRGRRHPDAGSGDYREHGADV